MKCPHCQNKTMISRIYYIGIDLEDISNEKYDTVADALEVLNVEEILWRQDGENVFEIKGIMRKSDNGEYARFMLVELGEE